MSGHKGIYDKYVVFRREEYDKARYENIPCAELDGCFILRPVTDTAARVALATYAEATHNPRLGKDIREWLEELRHGK